MADDICDWLAKEEADAEEWGGLGGARYYRKQFAAARTEIERLRASADQLANALRAVQHDRPSAHTDDVWAAINQALITHEEARRD